jgi:uncharacterized membrane protein
MLFGISLVLSHYSSAYVALGILILAFLTSVVITKVFRSDKTTIRTRFISGWLLLLLLVVTFFWSNIFTQTSANVFYVAQTTLLNMRDALLSDLRSEDTWQTFQLTASRFDIDDVNDYVREQTEEYSKLPGLYPPDTYQEFIPQVVRSAELRGVLGDSAVKSPLAIFFAIIRQLTKIFALVGAVVLVRQIFRIGEFDREYILLNLVGLMVLTFFLVLPVLSLYYNSFRFYMQILIVSSVSMLIGANFCLSFIRNPQTRVRLIGGLLVLFFLSASGATAYIIGGRSAMNLNNFGEDYDKFYTQEHEVYAARWLSSNRDPEIGIYADINSSLYLISFGNGILETEAAILPATITRESYVYLDYANLNIGIARALANGKQISYNYPLEFLDRNKSLIYDNGGAQIFR